MRTGPTLLTIALACGVQPALGSSSDWFETKGARVRLVTTGTPGADGRLTGILDIDLMPGWKTYWRDPGDSGVPPSVDLSASINLSGVQFAFPPPQRHDGGGFQWAGYDHPVAFPIELELASANGPISAAVFLGICETICIPVQASLTLDPKSDPDNPRDAAAVAAAKASLPQPDRPDFGVKVVSNPGDATIVLEASFPGDPETAELFVAAEEGYTFGTPRRVQRDGRTMFELEAGLPASAGAGSGLHYTLVTEAGSVSGLLPYF
jgi:DsbC/DsbD-like thiol-disulfide interchange protein